MTEQDFLHALEQALTGELPAAQVQANVAYYREYIRERLSGGRTQEEVLAELGDPRLIARSIVDAAAAGGKQQERESLFRGPVVFNGWKATLVIALVIIAVLSLISLVFRITFRILFSPVFWLLLIGWMLWRNRNGRRRW